MPADPDGAAAIRVFLVDDHRVVRSGVAAYLAQVDDIEVIGEAGDGRQALDRIAQLEPGGNLPDVVLMDLLMPGDGHHRGDPPDQGSLAGRRGSGDDQFRGRGQGPGRP